MKSMGIFFISFLLNEIETKLLSIIQPGFHKTTTTTNSKIEFLKKNIYHFEQKGNDFLQGLFVFKHHQEQKKIDGKQKWINRTLMIHITRNNNNNNKKQGLIKVNLKVKLFGKINFYFGSIWTQVKRAKNDKKMTIYTGIYFVCFEGIWLKNKIRISFDQWEKCFSWLNWKSLSSIM